MGRKRKQKQNAQREPDSAEQSFDLTKMLYTGGSVLTGALCCAAPMIPEGAAEEFSNWPLFLLWLIAGILLLAAIVSGGNLKARWATIDSLVVGICTLVVLSGLISIAQQSGHARSTINGLWQWTGFAIAFVVIRQLTQRVEFRTGIILLMLSVAIGISTAGLYQRWIVFPSMQSEYKNLSEEQRQQVLREGGINNVQPDSRERRMWENRLYSTDTTATFVLANSLAIFLTPWFVCALAFAMSRSHLGKPVGWAMIAGLILIGFCLILTKSRTAFLAVGASTVLLLFSRFKKQSWRIPWSILLGFFTIAIVVLAGASMFGLIDAEVFSEAPLSILYRLEYWQASGDMIADHWLMGVGPGNFQHQYSTYQLPQASETVSDPHNFLVEIWAVGGTPAALLLLTAIGIWLYRMRYVFVDSTAKQDSIPDDSGSQNLSGPSANLLMILGLLIGSFLVFIQVAILGLDPLTPLIAVIVAGLVMTGFLIASAGQPLPSIDQSTLCIAVAGLMIGLSASGGVSFPSIVIPAAVLFAGTLTAQGREIALNKTASVVGIVLLLSMLFLIRFTVIDPIHQARQLSQQADMEMRNGRFPAALESMDRAIAADPYDANYRFFRTQLCFTRFQSAPTLENLQELVSSAETAVAKRPQNSKVALETGKLFRTLAAGRGTQAEISSPEIRSIINDRMVRFFEIAQTRRPNDSFHAASLALALEMAGKKKKAAEWANLALELNQADPHADRDLGTRYFENVGSLKNDVPADRQTVEQVLEQIRKQ